MSWEVACAYLNIPHTDGWKKFHSLNAKLLRLAERDFVKSLYIFYFTLTGWRLEHRHQGKMAYKRVSTCDVCCIGLQEVWLWTFTERVFLSAWWPSVYWTLCTVFLAGNVDVISAKSAHLLNTLVYNRTAGDALNIHSACAEKIQTPVTAPLGWVVVPVRDAELWPHLPYLGRLLGRFFSNTDSIDLWGGWLCCLRVLNFGLLLVHTLSSSTL